jgi:hypothetical protein
MLDFLTKNFAVVSAAALIFTSVIVMAFVYSYLLVFDWRLMWIIEYADMTKFIILGVAVILSVGVVLGNLGSVVNYANMIKDIQLRRKHLIASGLVGLVAIGIFSWQDYTKTPFFEYHMELFITLLWIFAIISAAVLQTRTWFDQNWYAYTQSFLGLLVLVGLAGRTLGLYVRDVESNKYDIVVGGEKLRNQKIVMILSHHTILYDEGVVTILQSPNIKKFIANVTP